MTIGELIGENSNIETFGNKNIKIDGLNFCNRKSEKLNILAFATNTSYVDVVEKAEHIVALIVNEESYSAYEAIISKRNGCIIVACDPELFFYDIHEKLHRDGDFYEKFDFEPQIGTGCKIHKTAVIENGVIIGHNVRIGALTVVESGSVIEDNVIVGCGSVIGSEGFQVITRKGKEPLHISHVGKCRICKNVYIGDNVSISKSLFEGETYIGSGTKIDNLVHISHNTFVGNNVVIAASTMLCGTTEIKDGAWIAPNVSVLNRVTVGENAMVGMGSVVTRDVEEETLVYGSPARSH